jgi:hypothetical protein
MEHSLDADGDEEDTYYNLTDKSHQIKPSYVSLFIFLSHFIIFLYLISLLLYQRHDMDLFLVARGPSYMGLKAMMLTKPSFLLIIYFSHSFTI